MSNINATLAMARRALLTYQAALGVTGENIANVNTPGYARKRGELTQGPIIQTANGGFGTGVELLNIRGLRDPFIERQVRRAMSDASRFNESGRQLSIVESSLAELGESGLGASLDRFWDSWHQLAADPNNRGARNVVRETSRSLANRFQSLDDSLSDQERQIYNTIETKLERSNLILTQIARLNGESVRAGGNKQLDDQRAGLLDELAQLTGASYTLQQDGSVSVLFGGVFVVEGSHMRALDFTKDGSGRPVILPLIQGGVTPALEGGELAGLYDALDQGISSLKTQLNQLAVTLSTEVNRIHQSGFDQYGESGIAFFATDITGIGDFRLSDEIAADVSRIAVSSDGRDGNNGIALAIAGLEEALVAPGGKETIGEFYRAIITDIGSRINENSLMSESATLSLSQMNSWRESVSGVSMDEEMALLIRYENAFNAAAKLTQVLSQMMDTVLTIGI